MKFGRNLDNLKFRIYWDCLKYEEVSVGNGVKGKWEIDLFFFCFGGSWELL